MCLLIKNGKWPDCVQIAENDIVVYKNLKEDFVSPCRGFKYSLGEIYKTDFGPAIDRDGNCVIMEGFHAYVDKTMPSLLSRYPGSNVIVCKCVIPKGSKFIIGKFNEIVSNQIIILKTLGNIKRHSCLQTHNFKDFIWNANQGKTQGRTARDTEGDRDA